MPELIQCPNCNRKLRVPDNLIGKKVKCPSCSKAFVAAVEKEELDEEEMPRSRRRPLADEYEDEEDEEVRPRRRRRRRGSRARSIVAAPAIALMVVGGISLALYLIQLILILAGVDVLGLRDQNLPGAPQQAQAFNAGRIAGGVSGMIVAISWATTVLGAGIKMKNLQGYGYAMTGAIVAMLPCNVCCLLGLPFGIWSLVVLNKPEVKNAFR